MLSTRDIFCVFLHLSRAVLVRNSATSSSDSRERHFLFHSWIIASRPRVEESLIDGLFPMRPRFQSNVPSINLVSKEMYHRIDGILLASSKYGKYQLAFAPIRKGCIFWMNDKSGCSSNSPFKQESAEVTLWGIFPQENLNISNDHGVNIAEHGNHTSELKMFDLL